MLRTLGRAAGVLLFNLLLFAGLLEGGARLTDPWGISYFPETARFFDHFVHEEPIGYRLPPRFEGRFYGTQVKTNALGLREREIESPKPPRERRILVLGDSVPFSLGVEYEESIPHVLERILRRETGQPYRAVNMGVPSYNTEQELIQFDRVGAALEPDLVLLMLQANDIEAKRWVFERRASLAADLAQRSYAASLLFSLGREVVSPPAPPGSARDPRYAADHPRWLAIERSLVALAERARALGVPFVVTVGGADGDAHVEMPRAVGQTHGFPVEPMNLRHLSPWKDHPDDYVVSRSNGHCNPAGCRIIARRIASILRELGLVGGVASVDDAETP